MNDIIPIFYACDEGFLPYTVVSIRSLMENASKEERYAIHILHTSIPLQQQQKVCAMAKEPFEITFDDVTPRLDAIDDKLPLRDYYSKTTYFRIFIAQMFPAYQKAIYIDSDTVVLGDISALYRQDLGEHYVAAAREQVMVQIPVYGDYVEQVLGISRDYYFNAGVLLINTAAFRENAILAQFSRLLHRYTFVVTQDEDYLNLLCRGQVLWLDSCWNAETAVKIPCPESEIKIIHYIMTEKPWHYENCRLGSYFWKYADATDWADHIRATLAAYGEEEKEADRRCGEHLAEIARQEIAKEDNYLKLLNNGKLRSEDRLVILNRIEVLEKEGKFDIDVEEDPPSKILLPGKIDYLRRSPMSKVKREVTRQAARLFLEKLLHEKQLIVKEMVGIENFRSLSSGAIITCNHFNAMDSFAIQLAYEAAGLPWRNFYRVIREGNYTNFPGFYGVLMRNFNTLPLSSNRETMNKFMHSVDQLLKNGNFVLVYPEQSMWWNYRKPKPLKSGAFTFAVRNHVPVIPCFITMEDSDILGNDGFFIQEYTIHVGKPIDPGSTGNRHDRICEMQRENYAWWKSVYEKTYGEPLRYRCGNERLEKLL